MKTEIWYCPRVIEISGLKNKKWRCMICKYWNELKRGSYQECDYCKGKYFRFMKEGGEGR